MQARTDQHAARPQLICVTGLKPRDLHSVSVLRLAIRSPQSYMTPAGSAFARFGPDPPDMLANVRRVTLTCNVALFSPIAWIAELSCQQKPALVCLSDRPAYCGERVLSHGLVCLVCIHLIFYIASSSTSSSSSSLAIFSTMMLPDRPILSRIRPPLSNSYTSRGIGETSRKPYSCS